MSAELTPNRCRHIFVEGRQCGSRSLRHENFCYYHHTTRVPAPRVHISRTNHDEAFELPMPENRAAIQYGIGEVLRRLAATQIEHKTAALMLYGLSVASSNLSSGARYDTAPDQPSEPIVDIVIDPEEGLLAPTDQPLEPGQKLIAPGRVLRQDRAEELRKQLAFIDDLERNPRPIPRSSPYYGRVRHTPSPIPTFQPLPLAEVKVAIPHPEPSSRDRPVTAPS